MNYSSNHEKKLKENVTKKHRGISDSKVKQNLLLRKLIKDRDYKSEYSFAETLRISRNHLSMIIYYKRRPSFRLARKICDLLKIKDTYTLFAGELYGSDIQNDGRLAVNKRK